MLKKFLLSRAAKVVYTVIILGLGAYFGVDTTQFVNKPEPSPAPAPMPALYHGRVVDAGR